MTRKDSMQKLMTTAVAALAISIAWGAATAQAHSPQTSRFVDAVSLQMEPTHRFDNGTLYAGIDECERLIEDDRIFNVTFETNVFIENPDLFGGVYRYHFPRGEERQIACRTEEGALHEDCAGELDDDDIALFEFNVDVDVSFQDLTGLTDSAVCDEGELDQSHYVQLRLRDESGTGIDLTEWSFAEARLVFDLVRPERPTLVDALATENSIRVEFERSSTDDVRRHLVVHSTEPFEEGDLLDDIATTRSPRAVEGDETESGQVTAELEGGTTVFVGMVARDEAGNYSAVSAPMEVTVTETADFWDYYVDAGGEEEGGYGCGQAAQAPGAALWWLAAIFLAALWWRRRQHRVQAVKTVPTYKPRNRRR